MKTEQPMNDLRHIDDSLPGLNYENLIKLLSYGNDLLDENKKQNILMCTARFRIHKDFLINFCDKLNESL